MLKASSSNSILSSFKLTKSEKIWLQEIIKAYFNREKVDVITLGIKLSDKLDTEFDHNKIPYTLITNNSLPTLFCIWVIDPDNSILDLADKVLKLIQQHIKKDPTLRRFNCVELATSLNYPNGDMDLCIQLLYSLGQFFNSATSTTDRINGFNQVDVTDITYIRNILHYKDLKTTFGKEPFKNTQPKPEISVSLFPFPEEKGDIVLGSAFIIMRMDKDYIEGPEICKTIKEVCKLFEINAVRADDVEHSDKITDLILDKIRTSEFLIADLTGEKPNVYYEVGYAHAINRKPHLYRKVGTKLHFDLSVHNVPEYESIDDLRRQLTNRFSAIRQLKTMPKIKRKNP